MVTSDPRTTSITDLRQGGCRDRSATRRGGRPRGRSRRPCYPRRRTPADVPARGRPPTGIELGLSAGGHLLAARCRHVVRTRIAAIGPGVGEPHGRGGTVAAGGLACWRLPGEGSSGGCNSEPGLRRTNQTSEANSSGDCFCGPRYRRTDQTQVSSAAFRWLPLWARPSADRSYLPGKSQTTFWPLSTPLAPSRRRHPGGLFAKVYGARRSSLFGRTPGPPCSAGPTCHSHKASGLSAPRPSKRAGMLVAFRGAIKLGSSHLGSPSNPFSFLLWTCFFPSDPPPKMADPVHQRFPCIQGRKGEKSPQQGIGGGRKPHEDSATIDTRGSFLRSGC